MSFVTIANSLGLAAALIIVFAMGVFMVISVAKILAQARIEREKNIRSRSEIQDRRYDELEDRLANLETIVLEEEKRKSFDRAL